MGQELTDSCRECTSYARAKPGLGLGRAPIQHVSTYQPMTVMAVDIFGPLTTTDNGNHTDWDDHFPYVMAAYRATEHKSTAYPKSFDAK